MSDGCRSNSHKIRFASGQVTVLGEASVFADERENTRAPGLTQSSTIGIARIEVRKMPLPSDSANAIGGSVDIPNTNLLHDYAKYSYAKY